MANKSVRRKDFYSSPKMKDCIERILRDNYPVDVIWERMAIPGVCPPEYMITASEPLTGFFRLRPTVYRVAWTRSKGVL